MSRGINLMSHSVKLEERVFETRLGLEVMISRAAVWLDAKKEHYRWN